MGLQSSAATGSNETMNKKIVACWSYDAEKLLMISYDSTELTK